ncbi:MAG: hypothetical protein LAO20_04060 [Acidobacteriia bacterium]|nr:hypothetical protein [Terriglobia bacterium]
MKRSINIVLLAMTLTATATFLSASDQKDKKTTGSKVVDAGSFGIFMSGKRVGTETFHIEQRADLSVATSEIKVDDGKFKATQTSEMQITAKGELRSYNWRSTLPQKEESSVEAKDQLLVEHVVPADQKKMDVPHVLPLSTVILDDNFFSHREILVWRYLATGCLLKNNERLCGPSSFGILVPQQHVAASVSVELVGRDKLLVKGVEQEVNKVRMESEGIVWMLWVGDDYKVMKMAVPANNVEVVRD